MNTRITRIVLAAAALAVSLHAEGTIAKREQRQQGRIAGGVKSGQLTPAETARIEKKEARLNRQIRRDRIDGGGLTARERAKIDRRQDQLSRDIYRQKHDGQATK